ncbi:S8/S53 family peptidase [bacterium]|nr:S8/S53 family peptidase [bacterium]
MKLRRYLGLFFVIAIAGWLCAGLAGLVLQPQKPLPEPAVVYYDAAQYPHLFCLEGRVVAETDPALSAGERQRLWTEYGLRPRFEWIAEESGFTYHELALDASWAGRVARYLRNQPEPPRELPALVALLNEDPRIHWAAPDALLFEWCDEEITLPPGEELVIDEPVEAGDEEPDEDGAGEPADQPANMPMLGALIASDPAVDKPALPPYGVNFVNERLRPLKGGLAAWEADNDRMEPHPDFEYYRLCRPTGTAVEWAPELTASRTFSDNCTYAFGNNQAQALSDYHAAGDPPLAHVTVCVADTGVYYNHRDLAGRLCQSAIDANYASYQVTAAADRAEITEEITDRESARAVGLPREAIQGRPAAHGTSVAGIVARCTAGFGPDGNCVSILPASVKSTPTIALVGYKPKTPVSAFIKLIACLNQEFPTGEPGRGCPANTGDVRVMSMSACIPRSYFSDAEWKIVASLVGKAAGSIAEDLRENDRVYVFAAGNDKQPEPNRPGEMDYVIAVAASMAFDGETAWHLKVTDEGSSLGMKCVSAPGYGIITSTLTPEPNLAYLPDEEFRHEVNGFSIPPRVVLWSDRTYRFCATSSATPQVGALAALLYAQAPSRNYKDVRDRIYQCVGDRKLHAPWGDARGLVDYAAALGFAGGRD